LPGWSKITNIMKMHRKMCTTVKKVSIGFRQKGGGTIVKFPFA
jgi:hypothetical protein